MAKKEIRVASANAPMAIMVDNGMEADTEFKNAKNNSDAYRAKVGTGAVELMESGEKSIRISGEKATALVTRKESVKIDTKNESFVNVVEAVSKGYYGEAVKEKVTVTIPASKLAEVQKILGSSFDILTATKTDYVVDPEEYRTFDTGSSPEVAGAKDALDACTTTLVTTAVKYEVKKD